MIKWLLELKKITQVVKVTPKSSFVSKTQNWKNHIKKQIYNYGSNNAIGNFYPYSCFMIRLGKKTNEL